jgi:hypothetical protein
MKTFFAVRICDGIGAAGACACNTETNGSRNANPSNIATDLTFNIVVSFLTS